MNWWWKAALVGATTLACSVVAGPALGLQATVTDGTGDQSGPGLDITSATVRNLDHLIVARVRFAAAVRGDLIVSVDPRRAQGLRLVSQYRPGAVTRNFVLRGAFTDTGPAGRPGQIRCLGFRVTWSAATSVARMSLPSRCLHDGDFGAIRFAVLTERGSGDTDVAPERADGSIGSSPWIPRG